MNATCSNHSRLALIILPAIFFLVGTIGCAAARQVKRGEEALEAGRHEQAYRHFQSAVASKPDLQEDPAFQSQFQFARSRAAYEQAERLIAQQAYEQAVARLEESVEAAPQYMAARNALDAARQSAAGQLHQKALDLADQGQRDAAIEALERALHHQSQHAASRAALESLESPARTPAPASYAQGVRLARSHFWQRALIEFDRAIEANANHLPSRLARYQARESLKHAASLHAQAANQLDAKRLPEAIAFAQQAVELWPAHEKAQAVLTSATQSRDQAGALYDASRVHAIERRWDEAVQSLNASLEIYPYDNNVSAARDQTIRDAAADYTTAGQAALDARQLDDAEAAFQDALRFVADYRPAQEGIARTGYQRGQLAHERNLPGNALLWYLDAQQAANLPEIQQAIAAARQDLHTRGAVVLRLTIADSDRSGMGAADRLSAYFGQFTSNQAPPFIVLREDPQADYESVLTLQAAQVNERLKRSERRSHHYIEEVPAPNPRIPTLQSQLHRAESDLVSIERRFHDRCHRCGGAGHARCNYCHGRGHITCAACAGRGHMFIGAQRQPCGRCGGRGHAQCGRCHGGQINCTICRGTGRRYPNITAHDVSRARGRVSDLRHELSCEPDTILVRYDRTWPYTLEHHEKTGRLSTTLALRNRQGNIVGDDQAIPMDFSIADQRVIGANPELGLARDELDLPSDRVVIDDLTRRAAQRATALVIDRVGREVVASHIERGRAMAQAGDDAQAVEANVSAALFMEAVNANEAADLWAQIRSR